MKFASPLSAWRTTREQRTLARFNKQFSEQRERYRAEIDVIIADHAAKGILKSGATIKRGLRELEAAQGRAVADCLELISNITLHDGRRRRWLIKQLRVSIPNHSEGFWWITEERLLAVVAGGQAADDAAKQLWRGTLEKAIDQIEKYIDGLTSPRVVSWPERHPVLMLFIGTLIAAAAGWVSKLLGLL